MKTKKELAQALENLIGWVIHQTPSFPVELINAKRVLQESDPETDVVHVITYLEEGIHADPHVFSDMDQAGAFFEKLVTSRNLVCRSIMFRKKREDETWIEYQQAFGIYEDTQDHYDKNDFEIHWTETTVDAEFFPVDYRLIKIHGKIGLRVTDDGEVFETGKPDQPLIELKDYNRLMSDDDLRSQLEGILQYDYQDNKDQ